VVVISHADVAPAAVIVRSPTLTAVVVATDSLLFSYSQLLFSQSRLIGVLLMAATFTVPRLGLAGVLSVCTALAVAHTIRLSPDLNRCGLFGYNALLVGLAGAGLLEPGPAAFALTALAVVTTVLVTAAAHSMMASQFALPSLTLPFLVVVYLMLAAAPGVGVTLQPFPGETAPILGLASLEVGGLGLWLQSLGTIFLAPHALTGLLVAAALLLYSRIAALLSLAAFAAVWATSLVLYPDASPVLMWVLVLNATFTAVALGGVWFVPGRWAGLLATLGVALSILVGLGCHPVLSRLGLPLMILPFNATVLVLLVAMRQRVRDGRPKAVDFLPGTPEENLGHFRTRIARFGANYGVRLHAPFRGRWVCTQGVDGEHTHRGPWRHAADFEVLGSDGRTHRGRGRHCADYHCYRLPVLATADGTVIRAVDGIPDNAIGEVDLTERWGNLVLLYHGPGLYSLVAHLAPGSLRVQEGQIVRRGDPLGQCGCSGRSPVPHLHFHLQATALVGAPTVHLELHEVVAGPADREELHNTCVPVQRQQLRNVEPHKALAQTLRFEVGRPMKLRLDGRTEEVAAEIGLIGEQMLRSDRATLYFDSGERLFTVFDVLGSRGSALHLVRACLARVPLESSDQMVWHDHLPTRHVLPWYRCLLLSRNRDGRDGIPMRYHARTEGQRIVITGTSLPCNIAGMPLVRTEAVLCRGKGIERLRLVTPGHTREATAQDERKDR